jgi:hypothetical protein
MKPVPDLLFGLGETTNVFGRSLSPYRRFCFPDCNSSFPVAAFPPTVLDCWWDNSALSLRLQTRQLRGAEINAPKCELVARNLADQAHSQTGSRPAKPANEHLYSLEAHRGCVRPFLGRQLPRKPRSVLSALARTTNRHLEPLKGVPCPTSIGIFSRSLTTSLRR